jgi:hypothetical protein
MKTILISSIGYIRNLFLFLGGSAFIWRAIDWYKLRIAVPHVYTEICNLRVLTNGPDRYLAFGIRIKNPTNKKVVLIFSRVFCQSKRAVTSGTTVTDEEFFSSIRAVSSTPQPRELPAYRHVTNEFRYGEFITSPLGSAYYFEPGEEYFSEYSFPAVRDPEPHIADVRFEAIFMESIPDFSIEGDPNPGNPLQLSATVFETGLTYQGADIALVFRANKCLTFSTTKVIEVPAV